MKSLQLLRALLLPAAVFQGVIVGGGYGTGREVVEYVSRHGGYGGLLACTVIALCFGIVLALSFALAVRFRLHDYRHFLKLLLGRGWILFEILFSLLLVIAIAVVGAAAGQTLARGWDIPYGAGVLLILLIVAAANFYGRHCVERALGVWTVVLMFSLCVLVAHLASIADPGNFSRAFAGAHQAAPAALGGLQFAVYNSALIPVLIYCVSGLNDQRVAAVAGVIAGFFGALPALLLHLSFMAYYPAITTQAIPTAWLLDQSAPPWAMSWFSVVLFGTVVLTAVGILHGFNERLDGWREDAGQTALTPAAHALIAGGIVALSLALAHAGIIALVARGYGALSWAFLLVFTLPLLCRGTYLLSQRGDNAWLKT